MWLSVSILVVYGGFYLFIVFLSLSIACGLYYLAEMIEEYPITARKLLTGTIKFEFILHLLFLIDRLPFYCIALGIAAHVFYQRILKHFPYLQFTSQDGLLGCAAFIITNILWVRHLWSKYYTVEYIAAFLLVSTWLVPTGFFLSAAGDQAVLPGGAHMSNTYPYSSTLSPSKDDGRKGGNGKKRRSVALKVFDLLKSKRDEYMPSVLSKLPASAGVLKEKV